MLQSTLQNKREDASQNFNHQYTALLATLQNISVQPTIHFTASSTILNYFNCYQTVLLYNTRKYVKHTTLGVHIKPAHNINNTTGQCTQYIKHHYIVHQIKLRSAPGYRWPIWEFTTSARLKGLKAASSVKCCLEPSVGRKYNWGLKSVQQEVFS